MLTSRNLKSPSLKKIWHRYAYLPGLSTTQTMFHLAIIAIVVGAIIMAIMIPFSEDFDNPPVANTETAPEVTAERCDGC